MNDEYDFGGYATKVGLRCADGRIICKDAFKDNDGQIVPLVWGHQHNDPDLVLGHAKLENREDGVYAYCKLNNASKAKTARELVNNGDVNAFSIYANQLKQDGPNVMHGNIREVSLVLSGANPGALIENAAFAHSDGTIEDLDDEATIFNGWNLDRVHLEHADADEEKDMPKDDSNRTVGDVIDSMTDEQRKVLYFLVDKAEKEAGKDADEDDSDKEDSEEDWSEEDGEKEKEKEAAHDALQGYFLAHADESDDEPDDEEDLTVGDVIDSMNEDQKKVLDFLVAQALETNPDDVENDEGGKKEMKHNVFEEGEDYIMHSDIDTQGFFDTIMSDAQVNRGSFKDAFIRHADEFGIAVGDDSSFGDSLMHANEPFNYGIANPSQLFPEYRWVTNEPNIINYDQEWVNAIMNGVSKTPFSRIRTVDADIRIEDARARGYVRANEKANAFYRAARRDTAPTTVYVKQKFNRDDIQDITNFDVVNFTRVNVMRPKLNEEIARAILIGDGRDEGDDDKINEICIRPIVTDDTHYTDRKILTKSTDNVYEMIEEIAQAHSDFKGKGAATFFTSFAVHTKMKWAKDDNGTRVYKGGDSELIGDLNVANIVDVDTFLDNYVVNLDSGDYKVMGVKVALGDYNIGTDRGGDIFNAEDFDIDFNQYKYLMETRMSGALTRFHSAQVFLYPYTYTYVAATVTVGDTVPANTYYERSGSEGSYVYTLTDDTTFQSGTTYYTRY